jgi:hypothetical protein
LSIESLASLAVEQQQLHDRLLEIVPQPPPELAAAWEAAAGALLAYEKGKWPLTGDVLPQAFYVLVTCRDERHPVELLGRFKGEGIECKAVLG